MNREIPDIVANYFERCVSDPPESARSTLLEQTGEMRLAPDKPWLPFTAEQSVTAVRAGFVWHARVKMAPLVTAVVEDAYEDGRGRLDATDGTTSVHYAALLNKNFRALDYYMGEVPNPGAAGVTGLDNLYFSLAQWVHFAITVDQGGDLARWYIDGQLRESRSDTEGSVTWLTKTNNERLQVGGSPASADTSFHGHLDEIRVAETVRQAAWISAEHANQRSGSTFVTAGAEEGL